MPLLQEHSHCYQQKQTRIETYANSSFPSSIKLWNHLRQTQVNMTEIETFTYTYVCTIAFDL